MSLSVQFGAASLSQLNAALEKSGTEGVKISVENEPMGGCVYQAPPKISEYHLTAIQCDRPEKLASKLFTLYLTDDRDESSRRFLLSRRQGDDYHFPTINLIG